MSSAGHVMAMIQSMRNNRNLLKKRDILFNGLNKRVAKKYRHHTSQEQQMSAEQLQALRTRLVKENRQLLIKKMLVLIILIVLLALFFVWLNDALDLELINERYGFQELMILRMF
ncbi:hypothetical protein [Carboxylicivirga sp. RSCT41]|uniref:hypothetical protein n=1 Tax=Carboxylicivirga agarovorans TaxID=3417570 RepID=UPI003D342E5B